MAMSGLTQCNLQGTLESAFGLVLRGLDAPICRASAALAFQSLCRETQEEQASQLLAALLPAIMPRLLQTVGKLQLEERKGSCSSVKRPAERRAQL